MLLCGRNISQPTKWTRVMEVSSFDLPNLQRVLREGCGGGTGALSQTKWSIVGPVNLHLMLLYVAQGEKVNEGFYLLLLPTHPTPKGESYFLSCLFQKEDLRSQPPSQPLCSLSGKQEKVASTCKLVAVPVFCTSVCSCRRKKMVARAIRTIFSLGPQVGASVHVHVSSEEMEGGEPAFILPCLNFLPSVDDPLLSGPPDT